jgi:hypothetical protein
LPDKPYVLGGLLLFTLSDLSHLCVQVVHARALKALRNSQTLGGPFVFKNDSGKLMVYASAVSSHRERLQSVRTAAKRMAKQLNLDFKMVKQTKGCSPIYVYYEQGEDDPIPIYCDEGKTGDLQEIFSRLRNMMFVLSFHPKHAALKQARKALIAL